MRAVPLCLIVLISAGSAGAAKVPRRIVTGPEHQRFLQSIERCEVEAVRGFLESGGSPKERGAAPRSPLEVAVARAEKPECEAIAKLLLEYGASARLITEVPLVQAAREKGRLELADLLIKNGGVDCASALEAAAKAGDAGTLAFCGAAGVPHLVQLLSRKGADAIAVINTLSTVGPGAKEAIPALVQRMNDREVGVYAVAAVLKIDPARAQEVAPALVKHLDHKDPYLAAVALETIAGHGLAAQAPVEKVAALANQRDENLRMRAVAVLEQQVDTEAVKQRLTAAVSKCGKAVSRACEEGCALAADFDRDKRLDLVALVKAPGGTLVAVAPGRGKCKLTRLPFAGVETLSFDDDGRSLGIAVNSGERYATGRIKAGAIRWTFPRTD